MLGSITLKVVWCVLHAVDPLNLPTCPNQTGQSCRLCGAVVRRNTKRLMVPWYLVGRLTVANRHGQVLRGKKMSVKSEG